MKKTLNLLMFACLILPLAFSSCSKDSVIPPTATTMALVSGTNQSTVVETTLTDPIEVIVKDQNGNAYPEASVAFEVAEGSISSAT
ncbi:MAG: hypothetical protein ABFS32_23070, partial [Bacteroidota bacterium]